MKKASFESTLNRLLAGTRSGSLPALARALGITSQAVYDAKRRGVIPQRWIAIASEKFGLQVDELLAPAGGADELALVPYLEQSEPDKARNLDELCKELALEREERRSLANENRRLYQKCLEQERLIGELRLALQAARGEGNGTDAPVFAQSAPLNSLLNNE